MFRKRLVAIAPVLGLVALAFATPAAAAPSKEPIDNELEKYWNVEQAVPSLVNPLFERKGGFEGSVHLGLVPNDSYYLPMAFGGRLGYFLTDSLSLEAGFSLLTDTKSDLHEFLVCVPKPGGGCTSLAKGVREPPQTHWVGSVDLAYTPFHGKLGIFTSKLSSFDLGLSAGAGVINVSVDQSEFGNADPSPVTRLGAHWGANFRFYLTRWMNFRVDYKQFFYSPQSLPDGTATFASPVEFTAGLAFLTK